MRKTHLLQHFKCNMWQRVNVLYYCNMNEMICKTELAHLKNLTREFQKSPQTLKCGDVPDQYKFEGCGKKLLLDVGTDKAQISLHIYEV